MSNQMMCPFFREPCLREGCTAFQAAYTYENWVPGPGSGKKIDVGGLVSDRCMALSCNLPQGVTSHIGIPDPPKIDSSDDITDTFKNIADYFKRVDAWLRTKDV